MQRRQGLREDPQFDCSAIIPPPHLPSLGGKVWTICSSGMCAAAPAETVGIVGQRTLKTFVPQCFGGLIIKVLNIS